MTTFERPSPSEAADIAAVVDGIRRLQAKIAARTRGPLRRGTHAKGVCVRGEFEVLDLAATVPDPVLRARLARGLFARPGVYPAVIRFANGASRIARDARPDARALSFSLAVPPSLFGEAVTRLDFSMNDGPTSPLNDAHAFAVALRLLSATGLGGRLAALWSIGVRDLGGLAASAVRGSRLNRPGVTPYQRLRYWSVTPFRHGPDEAIKYSAIPDPANPARPLSGGPDALRDELIRHVAEDGRPSEFAFALQLLDADRMRHRGGRRDAAYWVENGSVDWPEDQAPFHVVARLRLRPGEHLSRQACQAAYFDVTAHAAPGFEPLGSINRARAAAEAASRQARLEQPAMPDPDEAPAVARPRRVTVRRVVRGAAKLALAAVVAFAVLFPVLLYVPQWLTPPLEQVDETVVLDQGFGDGIEAPARQRYYYTAQGAGFRGLRYSWMVNLEMPWGRERFAAPDHLRRYGFVYDPPTPANPDQLPVGFTRVFDARLNEDLLDITCAGCHTGEIHVRRGGRTIAIRIDGGAALHNFTAALPTIGASMVATVMNPFKFDRFARKVLGDAYPEGRLALHASMLRVLGGFGAIAWREQIAQNLYPTPDGYGRIDALARIRNIVFGEHLQDSNYAVGDGPVSFPPLWNIWKFDWVQYNASLSQPMARNIGEGLGVGATFALLDDAGRPLPPDQRFRTSSNLEQVHAIETTLRRLRPPAWPAAILGAVDATKAARGEQLFNQYCVRCHGPHVASDALRARNAPLKTAADPEWIMTTVCVDDIGTDPRTAMNYVNAFVDVRRTGLTADDLRAVARPGLDAWNERQAAYLRGEIARLEALAAPSEPESDAAEARARRIAALQTELDDLDAERDRSLAAIDPAHLPVALGLNLAGTLMRERAYDEHGVDAQERAEMDGFGILDRIQVIPAYKARPLAGMWSTAPFLHNGSVPTLYDLLSPADERPATFRMGSQMYDLERMGLAGQEGTFVFDTSLPGNSNRGHEFNRGYVPTDDGRPRQGLIGPYLEPADRFALIEYLKVRDDDAAAAAMYASGASAPSYYAGCVGTGPGR